MAQTKTFLTSIDGLGRPGCAAETRKPRTIALKSRTSRISCGARFFPRIKPSIEINPAAKRRHVVAPGAATRSLGFMNLQNRAPKGRHKACVLYVLMPPFQGSVPSPQLQPHVPPRFTWGYYMPPLRGSQAGFHSSIDGSFVPRTS